MDKRTAKRRACRMAATLIETTFDAGLDLINGDHDLTPQEGELVREQLYTLIAELERRGGS